MKKGVGKIVVPVFCAVSALGIFARTSGSESVRAIQILTLMTAGFGLGITFAVLMMNRRNKEM